jgi:hypothetical protein
MGLQTFDESFPVFANVTFTSVDTTVAKALFLASAPPARIDSIIATTDDTVAVVCDVFVRVGGVNYLLGSVTVPAGTGKAGTKGIDILQGALPATVLAIVVAGSNPIWIGLEATMTAAKTLWLSSVGGVV